MEKSQHVAAGEYLIEHIDKILEAFQAGIGVVNNMPEPITLDIARRLIWREVRRVFLQLQDGRPPDGAVNFLWLRVSVEPTVMDSATAQETLLELLESKHGTMRCYGPRGEGHPTVFYVTVRVGGFKDTENLLRALRARHFEVRDFTYNDG